MFDLRRVLKSGPDVSLKILYLNAAADSLRYKNAELQAAKL